MPGPIFDDRFAVLPGDVGDREVLRLIREVEAGQVELRVVFVELPLPAIVIVESAEAFVEDPDVREGNRVEFTVVVRFELRRTSCHEQGE